MTEFHFLRPLLLLLFVPLSILIHTLKQRKKAQAEIPIASHLKPFLDVSDEHKKWLAPQTLLPWFLSLMIVIVSGPTWKPEPNSHSQNQSPILFVIDLSRSMNDSDVAPNRLENSKLKLAALLEQKQDGIIGAYVYAGSSHMLIPPTKDHSVLELYLSALSTRLVPRQGKDLGAVLEQIAQDKTEHSIPSSIIIVSDSLDNSAVSALENYQQQYNDQLLLWKFGYAQTIGSPHDTRMIQNTPDNSDIQAILRWIDRFSYFDPLDESIEWQEVGYFLVFPTLMLSLLWFRRGWSIRWIPSFVISVLMFQTFSPTPAWANQTLETEQCNTVLMSLFMTPDQQGQWYYHRGEFYCAANSFVDQEWKIQALMKSHQWEWALTMLNNQPDTVDTRFKVALSYLNIQRFRSSQRWFEQVVELEPNHVQAIHNLALLDEIFDLMADRAAGQGTAGEDMTADVISTLQEDMMIDEPEDKVEVINSADLIAEEHLTKIWLEQVKANPEVFLRNKFSIQLQQTPEVSP
ncbi:VWA domain-containing protein [Vibrio sp. FNV 38]|nr:VWA domain-containing protein [Vibrio sp. FNV 38]